MYRHESLVLLRERNLEYVCTVPGGGYCHIWAIWVCAAVKGMIFKQFTLG